MSFAESELARRGQEARWGKQVRQPRKRAQTEVCATKRKRPDRSRGAVFYRNKYTTGKKICQGKVWEIIEAKRDKGGSSHRHGAEVREKESFKSFIPELLRNPDGNPDVHPSYDRAVGQFGFLTYCVTNKKSKLTPHPTGRLSPF